MEAPRSSRLMTVAVALAVGCSVATVVVITWLVAFDGAATLAARRPPSPFADIESEGRVLALSDVAGALNPNAPIAVIEVSDFECPYCGEYARTVLPRIRQEWVETGRLGYVFVNLPLERLHPNAFGAAVAAECARREGAFWQMHDALFANQGKLSVTDVSGYAMALGIEPARFARCISSEGHEQIVRDKGTASRLGVTSTPTFLFGTVDREGKILLRRRLRGAADENAFRLAIESLSGDAPQ